MSPKPDLDRLQAHAAQAAQLLRGMANPERLLLLCQLSHEELNVGELHARLGIVQPTLSQQLSVLRREGLVATRRDGRQVYYRLASADVAAVIGTLHHLFCSEENTI